MVILDEEAANERSPLKSPNAQLPPQSQAAPPPPYAASASTPMSPGGYVQTPGYHTIPPQHESPALLIRRDTPGQRFIKAFACALFVLFLWGMFVDTLSLLGGRHNHKIGGYMTEPSSGERLQGVTPTSPPCLCATSTPIRVLPIQYPPAALPSVQAAPSNPAPCATSSPSA